MLIHLHKQATTTPKVRAAIQASGDAGTALAERFGVTRQVLGQSPRLARGAWGSFVRIGRTGRDLFLDRGNLFLGFRDGGFQILQRQFQLRRVQFFRFRSELRLSVLSDLAFQLLDQCRQFGDEGVLFGDDRLFMQTRRTLDRKLKLQRRNSLHHLGRKVWKLAEIEGLRHANS